MKTCISNGRVFTLDSSGTILPNADVYLQDNKIVAVAPEHPPFPPSSADVHLDASGCNVLPGFVNAHGHLALGLFRGLGEFVPGLPWENYFDQQAALGKYLTLDDYYLGAQVLMAEMIRAGITSFADINFEGENAPPVTDALAQAVEHCGMRGVVCLETAGYTNTGASRMRYTQAEVDRSLQHSVSFAQKWHGRAGGRITAMLGIGNPPAPMRYELEKVAQAAKELGLAIQMHVCEIAYEMEEWKTIYGQRPVEILRQTGILDQHCLGGNVIFMDEEDARILRDYPFHASACPKNCCKMTLGMLDIPALLANEVNVCLGTNEVVNNNRLDMLEEMRMAALYHKMRRNDPAVLWGDAPLRLVTDRGGRALGTGVGVLEPGRLADIIIMDRTGPHMQPDHDSLANLVYSAAAADTRSVIIDGKVVMKDREILAFDAPSAIRQLQTRLAPLQEKIPPRTPSDRSVDWVVQWAVER